MRWLVAAIIATAVLFVSGCAYAATFSGIEFSTSPKIPRPNERLTVTANYIGADPGRYVFVWVVDGTETTRGVGVDRITLDTPSVGRSKEILVSVLEKDVLIVSKSLILRPAGVSIEWEGAGQRTPFAPIRPFFTGHDAVSVTAIPDVRLPDGSRLDTSDLYFAWDVNGVSQKSASGYGKNTLTVPTPFFSQSFQVGVVVDGAQATIRGSDRVTVRPRSPEFVVYRVSPLEGIDDSHAVTNTVHFDTPEISFIAYPLHISSLIDDRISWYLNDEQITTSAGDQKTVTFRKTAEGSGDFDVRVQYTDTQKFLDRMQRSFNVYF